MQRHFHSRRLSKSFLRTLSCSWGQQPKTGTFLNVKVPQRVSVPSQDLLALGIKCACLWVCILCICLGDFICFVRLQISPSVFCSQQLCLPSQMICLSSAERNLRRRSLTFTHTKMKKRAEEELRCICAVAWKTSNENTKNTLLCIWSHTRHTSAVLMTWAAKKQWGMKQCLSDTSTSTCTTLIGTLYIAHFH